MFRRTTSGAPSTAPSTSLEGAQEVSADQANCVRCEITYQLKSCTAREAEGVSHAFAIRFTLSWCSTQRGEPLWSARCLCLQPAGKLHAHQASTRLLAERRLPELVLLGRDVVHPRDALVLAKPLPLTQVVRALRDGATKKRKSALTRRGDFACDYSCTLNEVIYSAYSVEWPR